MYAFFIKIVALLPEKMTKNVKKSYIVKKTEKNVLDQSLYQDPLER